jgi:cell division protein ZapA (FtsZ GTPase activity inhibitor)
MVINRIMQDSTPINVVIGDRSYRIRIAPTDEEMVRKVIRKINEQVVSFKTQYAGKDMQDYIAMVLLWYVTDQQEHGNSNEDQSISEKLNELEALLDRHIAS